MEKSSGQEINIVISDMSLYPMPLYPKFTVTGFILFSQFCMHVQLFSHRGSGGFSAVCKHPKDYSEFYLRQLTVHIQ